MAQTRLLNSTRLCENTYLGRSQLEMELVDVSCRIFLGFFLLAMFAHEVEAENQPLVSALYIFGDSTIDPGNNNVLHSLVKPNFPPYGRDFPTGQPTGRFTDGRLITDILCKH